MPLQQYRYKWEDLIQYRKPQQKKSVQFRFCCSQRQISIQVKIAKLISLFLVGARRKTDESAEKDWTKVFGPACKFIS